LKKKKILLFTTDFPPSNGGGICTHSAFLVEILRPLGWEFNVLCEYYIDSSDDEIKKYAIENDIKIQKLKPAPSFFLLLKKIWFCYSYTKKYKPEILIGTGRHPTWYAAIISKITGTPLVTIGHGTEFTQKTSKKDFKWNRLAYGQSSKLIAISEFTKKTIENCGIKPKTITVINNAANESEFKILDSTIINEFKLKNSLIGKKIILATGSLSERKGQKVVIKALPKIVAEFPNVLFVAIGIPSLRDEMFELAKSLKVANNVLFPGKVSSDELLLWLNVCDIFTMTSVNYSGDYEGFGIAVLEAALCGKTALVSDNGGLPEAVSDQVTGIIVPENDPNETAIQIIKLFKNEDLLVKLSKQARENVLMNNSYEVKAREYHNELKALLKRTSG
jgi:glycosyltransferase involved in cell wall biosynthesis